MQNIKGVAQINVTSDQKKKKELMEKIIPGLNFCLLLRIPENESSFTIALDEPKRVFLRARHVVTSLHQPPP